ncbi:MAG: Gfo/Idh/MocA family oxidoreductase [Devosia sp.]
MNTLESGRPVRLGYVGCGFIAQHIHLPNFASLADCELVALAELRPELGRKVADHYGIKTLVGSHQALIDDPNIDAVAVSADYVVQGEIAADLLAAGKHVFMEKPMAVSVRQAETILAAAEKGGGRLMIGYMKRYDPGNLLARETVRKWRQSGDKGKLLYLRNHGFTGNWTAGRDTKALITTDEAMPPKPRDHFAPDWLPPDAISKYIGYLQQYTHNINLARFVLDTPTEKVTVKTVDLDEDGMTGLVVFDMDGTRVTVESAQTKFHGWDEHTQIYFERGWVHVHSPVLFANPGQPKVEIYEGGDTPSYSYPIPTPIAAWHFKEEAQHFLDALRSGEPFRSPGTDALADVTLLETIYRKHLGL